MTYAELLRRLDERFPKHGPCGLCGGPDARHRLWDAIVGQARGGDSDRVIARWMRLPVRDVRLVLVAYATARSLHRALPGSLWDLRRA